MDTNVVHDVKDTSRFFHFCVTLRTQFEDRDATVIAYVDFQLSNNAIREYHEAVIMQFLYKIINSIKTLPVLFI